MARALSLVAVAALLVLVTPASALWPKPQSMTTGSGCFSLDKSTFQFKATGVSSDMLNFSMKRYMSIVFKGAIPAASPAGGATGAVSALNIDVLTNDETLDLQTNENYTLTIASPTSTLKASTVYGAMRGLETFAQSVYLGSDGSFLVNEASITDFPRFHHRGIMIDTARHYLDLGVILEHLDAMSYSKNNVLHWHLVDDQSFPYESVKYPSLAAKGAYNNKTHVYTPAQVQQVINYGKSLGIRVTPEFDTPGHTRAWGYGEPELLTPCYDGSKPDGSYGPINPTLNSTFEFLEGFFGEVATTFPDHYIHLGGDEVSFNCWASNPDVQKWMTEHKLSNYADLENYYEVKLLDIINKLNKGYIVWQEIFDNGLKVRPDTVIDVWKGGWQDEIASVTASGLRAILSSPWYLNYISYGEDWPKYYNVEPLNFTGTPEAKKLVMGGEVCMWAEFVDATNFMSRVWPRAASVSERLWSAEDVRDLGDATERMHVHRCRLLKRGINAEPPSGPSFCEFEFVPTYFPPWSNDEL